MEEFEEEIELLKSDITEISGIDSAVAQTFRDEAIRIIKQELPHIVDRVFISVKPTLSSYYKKIGNNHYIQFGSHTISILQNNRYPTYKIFFVTHNTLFSIEHYKIENPKERLVSLLLEEVAHLITTIKYPAYNYNPHKSNEFVSIFKEVWNKYYKQLMEEF